MLGIIIRHGLINKNALLSGQWRVVSCLMEALIQAPSLLCVVLGGCNFNIYVGISFIQNDIRPAFGCLEQNATLELPVDIMVNPPLEKIAELRPVCSSEAHYVYVAADNGFQ